MEAAAAVDDAVVDSWEDLMTEEELQNSKQAATPAVRQKPGRQSKAKPGVSRGGSDTGVLNDPIAEKLRQRRLVEQEDHKLAADLFEGCELVSDDEESNATATAGKGSRAPVKGKAADRNDLLEHFAIKSMKDAEFLATKLCERIQCSSAKSPVWLRLLDLVLQACAPKMQEKDLKTMTNKIEVFLRQSELRKRDAIDSKRKPNDTRVSVRNYTDEMELFYGDLSEEEEEEAEDDAVAEFYKDFIDKEAKDAAKLKTKSASASAPAVATSRERKDGRSLI